MTDRILYVDEVLSIIGCSRPTLNREVTTGSLPPGRYVAGRLGWLETEIQTYLNDLPKQRFTGRVGRPRREAAA